MLLIPGSPGELLDKISILEIKSERITDAGKRNNVLHELQLLQEVRAKSVPESRDLGRLYNSLKSLNEKLWDIEDALRDLERKKSFGEVFIECARSVYRTNDKRSALKREINRLQGSEIIEEKSYSDCG